MRCGNTNDQDLIALGVYANCVNMLGAARYSIKRRLGDGAFGEVLEAVDNADGMTVAIKRVYIKEQKSGCEYSASETGYRDARSHVYRHTVDWLAHRSTRAADFPMSTYRELQCHRILEHPNVVAMSDYYMESGALALVLEPLAIDLAELLDVSLHLLPEPAIRRIARMLLSGLAHCHACGIMHRDIKPANVLFDSSGVLKIGDFGIARPFARADGSARSAADGVCASEGAQYTCQVTSRWYRSPEVLFGSSRYGPPTDLWAVGCVIAELYNGTPLLPGTSDIEQLARVLAVRGTPVLSGPSAWPEVASLPDYSKINFTPTPAPPLASLVPRACSDALELLDSILQLNPAKRMTAADALNHRFFTAASGPMATDAELAAIVGEAVVASRERRRSGEPPRDSNGLSMHWTTATGDHFSVGDDFEDSDEGLDLIAR